MQGTSFPHSLLRTRGPGGLAESPGTGAVEAVPFREGAGAQGAEVRGNPQVCTTGVEDHPEFRCGTGAAPRAIPRLALKNLKYS